MLNRIEEMMDHLGAQPNAAEGFSAKTMYETGMQFGLTCKEVKDYLLGKQRAISRGKYPAVAPNLNVLSMPAPKVMKKVAKRNTSSAVLEKAEAKDEAKLAERLELIKAIAKRHKDEDETVAELSKGNDDCSKSADDADDATIEELEKLMNASTINPLTA